MGRRERVLGGLAAALAGALLALAGTPAVRELPAESEPQLASVPAPLVRTRIEPPSATPTPATRPTAPRNLALARRPELPAEVRLCWSPTARRLLGAAAQAHLERLGARVRVCTESDRGARGRLLRGADDLALVAGSATDEERAHGLHSRVLGYHVLVAVVHERNPLAALPRHALRAALIGETTDWQHLGAPGSAAITVASVEEDPFTDQAASLVLLGDRLARGWTRLVDDRAVVAHVAASAHALGLCSLAAVQQAPAGVRVLQVDNVAPSAAAYAAGHYPYASPIRVVARDARAVAWLADLAPGAALSPAR